MQGYFDVIADGAYSCNRALQA